MQLLQKPIVEQRPPSVVPAGGQRPEVTMRLRQEPTERRREVPAAPRQPPPRDQGHAVQAATDVIVGWVLGLVHVAAAFLLYAVVILAVPVLPFILPLLLAPVVIFYGLVILGAGKVLAALGLV